MMYDTDMSGRSLPLLLPDERVRVEELREKFLVPESPTREVYLHLTPSVTVLALAEETVA